MGAGSKKDYKECGLARVDKYKGIRQPMCNGGNGCNRCWAKYHSEEARDERALRARWRPS